MCHSIKSTCHILQQYLKSALFLLYFDTLKSHPQFYQKHSAETFYNNVFHSFTPLRQVLDAYGVHPELSLYDKLFVLYTILCASGYDVMTLPG